MKRSDVKNRALTLIAAVLAMLIAGLPAGQAIAQSTATSYTSVLTGEVVRTSGPWAIDMDTTGEGDGAEVVVATGVDNGVMLAWLPRNTDLQAGRDYMLDQFASLFDTIVPVDKGAYGNVSYSLDIGNAEGIEFGLFSLFLGQRASGYVEYYVYMGPVITFAQGFASAQQNVTVGGSRIFQDVDGQGLQQFLNQNAGAAGGTVAAPNENVLGGENRDATASDTQRPVPTAPGDAAASADGDAYIDTIRGELDYLQTSLDEFIINFAGIQGDNADAAVQEINRISGEWFDYVDRADAIDSPAGLEDIDAAYRTLADDVESMGRDWRNYVSALRAGSGTDEAVGVFLDSMNAVQQGIDDVTAMLDAQATGGRSTTSAPAEPETTEEAATGTGGSSKGSLGGVTKGGNESETGASGQTSPTTKGSGAGDYADLGLVDDGTFQSPQTGTEITWDRTWYFDDVYDEPIASDVESGLDSVTISWAEDSSVTIFLSVGASGGVTPADLAALWVSPDYLAETSAPGASILLNETGRSGAVSVMMRDYLDDGSGIVILRSAKCVDAACNTIVMSTMIGLPDTFADAYRDARGGINVDGARLFDVLSPRNVSTAIGS